MIFSSADILTVWVAVVCVALAFIITGGVLILIVIRKHYLRYIYVTVTVTVIIIIRSVYPHSPPSTSLNSPIVASRNSSSTQLV